MEYKDLNTFFKIYVTGLFLDTVSYSLNPSMLKRSYNNLHSILHI